jgi:2-polyprenyl-3-methyl-5-hydroxy-6-metoxy-1,4-benzoquinol methylase
MAPQRRSLLSRIGDRCFGLAHRWVLGRRGYGRPVSEAVWNRQYREGEWDFLYSSEERAHYEAIVGFIAQWGPGARVLDVGCGHGRLLELLGESGYARYVGVDLSPVAVERARALGLARTHFEVADFQSWETREQFDVVVFNESLYYALRPAATARRFAARLAPGGRMVVSLVDYGDHKVIWRKLEESFAVRASRHERNAAGQGWQIKVLQEPAPE